ncbi:MAG TPA: GIY-YIG nuclease family protein [Thermoanaerobaculaceae bacterium]|jgi:putative endonuclease|nr:GIY-YIG nuclease family protein [Thermoanaerobaculaceae bacterium]
MTKRPVVYILASCRNRTLYVGVTSNPVTLIWQHRNDSIDGFTRKYHVHILVYHEVHREISQAITREKQLKKWRRAWKLALIERHNPEWRDLWDEIA